MRSHQASLFFLGLMGFLAFVCSVFKMISTRSCATFPSQGSEISRHCVFYCRCKRSGWYQLWLPLTLQPHRRRWLQSPLALAKEGIRDRNYFKKKDSNLQWVGPGCFRGTCSGRKCTRPWQPGSRERRTQPRWQRILLRMRSLQPMPASAVPFPHRWALQRSPVAAWNHQRQEDNWHVVEVEMTTVTSANTNHHETSSEEFVSLFTDSSLT